MKAMRKMSGDAIDPRREQLEQLAAEGDQAAVAELWQVYGLDRRSAQS